MIRTLRLRLAALLLACAPLAVGYLRAETALSLGGSLELGLDIDEGRALDLALESLVPIEELLPGGSARASLSLAGELGSFAVRFEAEARLGRYGGPPAIALAEASLSLPLGDLGLVRAGLLRRDSSEVLLLPSLDFLSPSRAEALFAGESGDSWPELLLESRFYSGPFSAILTFLPLGPPLDPLDPRSPWFPTGSLPESIEFFGTVFRRRAVSAETVLPELRYDPAFRAELRFSGELAELAGLMFWGTERSAAWLAEVAFPEGVFPSPRPMEIELFPVRGRVLGLGWGGSLYAGNFRIAAEGVLVRGRAADSGAIEFEEDALSFRSLPTYVDEAALSGSVSWTPGSVPLRLALEGRASLWPGLASEAKRPGPGSLAALACSTSAFEGLELELLALASIEDGSAAAVLRARLELGGDASLGLVVPLFFGPAESELGRYGQAPRAALSLRTGF